MKKYKNFNKGAMSFGMEILIFMIALFILWVLTGGAKKNTETKPFIVPLTNENNPGMTYGPGELKN